jgi:hypothetical protein
MTVNGAFRTRIIWPIGLWPFGNRFRATVWPITATLRASNSSCVVKNEPVATVQF